MNVGPLVEGSAYAAAGIVRHSERFLCAEALCYFAEQITGSVNQSGFVMRTNVIVVGATRRLPSPVVVVMNASSLTFLPPQTVQHQP